MSNYDDIVDIEFGGIDHRDSPDYCDAYITHARYKRTGLALTDDELDTLNDDDDYRYNMLVKYLH